MVKSLVATILLLSGPLPALDTRPESAAHIAGKRLDLHTRENGAKLWIAAETVAGPNGRAIEVKWSIEYNGSRRPFTILAPSLTRPASDNTYLAVYCDNWIGVGQYLYCSPPPRPRDWAPRAEDFVISKGGEPVTGTLTVSLADLGKQAVKKGVRKFQPGSRVYIQLRFTTNDRGNTGGNELDAWTGELWSNPVAVTIK